jgi:hypothetical protein
VRALSGYVARIVLDAEKGRAQNKKFWIARPFTRILNWKEDFISCKMFIEKKLFFALGFKLSAPEKISSA